MKNLLPPGAPTFLPDDSIQLLKSSIRDAYENIMLDTAHSQYLSDFGSDKGIIRPIVYFHDDHAWRAVLRELLFNHKHTRDAVKRVFEIILGPLDTQVTVLDRNYHSGIDVGSKLTIAGSVNDGTYTIKEVRMHELVFDANSFGTVPASNIKYTASGLSGVNGEVFVDEDNFHVLRDTSREFINIHTGDYLCSLNTEMPPYGTLIFNKNSPTDEEAIRYHFYDNKRSGILKLTVHTLTSRDKYIQIRGSTLAEDITAKDTVLKVKDNAGFPENKVASPAVTPGTDELEVFVPGENSTMHTIVSASGSEITVDPTTPLTIPAGSPATKIHYAIGKPTGGIPLTSPVKDLEVTGTIHSNKGRVLNTTTLADKTKIFDSPVDTQRFCVTINRGELSEETLEVTHMSGTSFYLISDPENKTGDESLLKFDHFVGESVEVSFTERKTSSSYFPVYGGGLVEGTDTSTVGVKNKITDSNAVLDALIAGSELEITGPTTSPNYGLRSKIISVDTGSGIITVDQEFPEETKGQKYKVRMNYGPPLETEGWSYAGDDTLYLSDTSGLPKYNFSLILDRGEPNEEVVWIAENTILNDSTNFGKLRISNNEDGYSYVSKKHKFGMSVEAAQVLVESCGWDIVETRSTGEYSVVISEECLLDIEQGFYLHEKVDTLKFINDDSDSIAGVESVGVAVAAVGDEHIYIDLDGFGKSIANKTSKYIFRSARIEDPTTEKKEDIFLVKEKTFTELAEAFPGNMIDPPYGSPIYLHVNSTEDFYVGQRIIIDKWGQHTELAEAFPGTGIIDPPYHTLTYVHVKSIEDFSVGQSIVIDKWGSDEATAVIEALHDAGTSSSPHPIIELTEPILDTNYLTGTSVRGKTAKILLESPLKNAYTSSSKVSLLWMYNEHVHDSTLSSKEHIASGGDSGGNYILSAISQLHPASVGDFVEITSSQFTPDLIGQKREIIKVGGQHGNKIYVDPPFTHQIKVTDKYKIHADLQLGDTNHQYYMGELSVYPGSYLYNKFFSEKNKYGEVEFTFPYNQITHRISRLATKIDPDNEKAVYQIPSTAYMIAPPIVDYALGQADAASSITKVVTSQSDVEPSKYSSVAGKLLEVLDPTHINYKRLFHVTSAVAVGANQTHINLSNPLDMPLEPKTGNSFRILNSLTKSFAADFNSTEFYIDDASLFPDTVQNPIYVNVADGLANEDLLEIISIDKKRNLLKITPGSESLLDTTYTAGTTVNLSVKYISLESASGWPTSGGAFYFEYGFTGNSTVFDAIDITGTVSGVTADPSITDESKDFMGYGYPFTLVGAKVLITKDSYGNALPDHLPTIINVDNDSIYLDSNFISDGNPYTVTIGDTYKIINKHVEVDSKEDGGHVDGVGGVITPILTTKFSGKTSHPARRGGIHQEYVEYSSRVGNVLELSEYRTFNFPRPPGSQVILASGKFKNDRSGKEHRPYLNGNLIDIILNETLSPFPGVISAAGIVPKTEVSYIGKKNA